MEQIAKLCHSRWEARDCGRLFHGVAEGRPGLTVDRYGDFCLVQSWRDAPTEAELQGFPGTVVFTPRGPDRSWSGPPVQGQFSELGVRYRFQTPPPGTDPWLFLDLRAARQRLLECATGDVLNTFAYTCGAGLVSARAGARVLNLDHSGAHLDVGRDNAGLNGLEMSYLQEDFLCAVRQFAGLRVRHKRGMRRYRPRTFDLIVLDPPTLTRGPFGAVDIVRDYPSLLKPCLLCLSPGGAVVATHHSSQTSWAEWMDVVKRCADKAGRPIREVERIEVEADFPSFDGEPPLKMAVLRV